jgi:hypothetical protein
MTDPAYPKHVCKLQKAFYSLKQAPRAWFDRFSIFLFKYGFFFNLANPSLFIFHSNPGTLILFLYVDDILLTSSSITLVSSFIQLLSTEFKMKDWGIFITFLTLKYHKHRLVYTCPNLIMLLLSWKRQNGRLQAYEHIS